MDIHSEFISSQVILMQTRAFPPEVFARLAPDIFFERHIDEGLRPCGRKLLERRAPVVKQGDSSNLQGSLGTAVVRADGAVVVCGITGGMTRYVGEGGIFANVEIHRGGMSGNPSGEEQVLTMEVDRLIKAAKFDHREFEICEEFELCLNAQIVVLSRTGPMLDLVWSSLVNALQATSVPKFQQNEESLEMEPTNEFRPLSLPLGLADVHRTYGVFNGIILADIDGNVEEECVVDRIKIANSSKTGLLSGLSISTPDGCGAATLEKIFADL